MDLLFLCVKALGNLSAQRRLNTGQSGNTKHDDWNKNKKGDNEGGDKCGGKDLVASENAAGLGHGGIRCECGVEDRGGTGFGQGLPSGKMGRRTGENYEVLRKAR